MSTTPTAPIYPVLRPSHVAGFFSCCTILLEHILDYYNEHHVPPAQLDTTGMFSWYKTPQEYHTHQDIRPHYFHPTPYTKTTPDISYCGPVRSTHKQVEQQFVNYQYVNYQDLRPFIERYFSPAPEIQDMITDITAKYGLVPSETCVLFHRGNDKQRETQLPNYDQYVNTARSLLNLHPQLKFLVQSDETEFLEQMAAAFPDNHVILWDEIRHIPSANTTVDRVFQESNAVASKYFLAITYLMAQCQFVVCGSGNCSYWIALFRGHNDGIKQFNYWVEK